MKMESIMYNKNSSTSSICSNKVTTSNSLLVGSDDINNKHGRSKAQMSLKKIIDIISSGSYEKENKFEDNEKKRGLGVDLNLRLGCFSNDDNGFSSDCSGVIGGGERGLDYVNNGENNVEFTSGSNLVQNCDLKGVVDVIEVGEEEEERRELSEVTDLETPEIEEKEDGVMEEVVVEVRETKKKGEKGYLDLLVDAARFISGNFADETEEDKRKNLDDEVIETKRRKSKRNKDECLMTDVYEDFEDISPVVKSKRGRNQVLPFRYRDSVLDPWKSTKQQGRSSRKRVSNRNRN